MVAFLKSLTDTDFVNDPKYANPSCPDDLPDSCPGTPPSYATQVGAHRQQHVRRRLPRAGRDRAESPDRRLRAPLRT